MIGNTAYFAAIMGELESGGYEAMLYELLHRDLSNVNLRAVPVTAALQDQRKRSLDTIHRWWMDVLLRGNVWQSECGLEDYFGKWHEFVATELLAASYHRFCREQREHRPLDREAFGKWMDQFAKRARPRGLRVVGEHRSRGDAQLTEKDRARGYKLGTLAGAQKTFVKVTGLSIAWP